MPAFKIGHLIKDSALIHTARQAAIELLRQDPGLKHPDHAALKAAVQAAYAPKWFLGATG